jgi:hypothetical protein
MGTTVRDGSVPVRPTIRHQDQHGQGHGTEHRLELAVDGAVTPEAIPVDRAYAHFLGAMASSSNPDAVAVALQQVGLDAADRARFLAALDPLRVELGSLAALRAADATALLQQEGRQALERARLRVEAGLSPAGVARLDRYVRTDVARSVKIYRGRMPVSVPDRESQP